MTIYKLSKDARERFTKAPEAYADLQFGKLPANDVACLIVGGQIAVVYDASLPEELQTFWKETWEQHRTRVSSDAILGAYEKWMNSHDAIEVEPIDVASTNFAAVLSGGPPPPPPPNRPNVVPGGVPIAGVPPGHLPFAASTRTGEVFFRCEAWPTSRRLLNGLSPKIVKDTYASPESERPFIPTGFAAVARCALPSFFPAVFTYEVLPKARSRIRCGAVVPMFGQSGGGVEVMLPKATDAQPFVRTIIQPL